MHTSRPVHRFRRRLKGLRKKREAYRAKTFEMASVEARMTYYRIMALREEIGPIDFDVVGAIREIRNG